MRIASIPAGHPYVQRSLRGLQVLSDPAPPGAGPGQWWPPVMWDAHWIHAHAGTFDVMHVHFGMESFSHAHMMAALAALAAEDRPLVLTVHDLENPQLADQARHLEQLDLLIGAADAVVTLTAGAADEIAERWGRPAIVIPHPRLVDRPERFIASIPAGPARFGIHLKDLRPSVDGPGTVAAAASAMRRAAPEGSVLEVHLHERVRDPEAAHQVRAIVAADPAIELHVHPRLGDDELAASISGLSAAILPYRHGTHSGWLELCWDLGVPVVAPAIGHLTGQHETGVFAFVRGDHDGTVGSMAGAMSAALLATPERPEEVRVRSLERDRQEAAIAAAHTELYRSLIGGHLSDTSAARPTVARTRR